MIKEIAKPIVHSITGTRKFYYGRLRDIAPSVKGKRVLEIGSGRLIKGEEAYSAIHIFKDVVEFRQTDLDVSFGHEPLDITDMNVQQTYDLILCLNVLEHVYDFQLAIRNLHDALVNGGRLVIAVPFAFPLHDEPHDYYRYTEFALHRMLSAFDKVEVEIKGFRKMPFGHFVIATK